jgi:hypothetical protein
LFAFWILCLLSDFILVLSCVCPGLFTVNYCGIRLCIVIYLFILSVKGLLFFLLIGYLVNDDPEPNSMYSLVRLFVKKNCKQSHLYLTQLKLNRDAFFGYTYSQRYFNDGQDLRLQEAERDSCRPSSRFPREPTARSNHARLY